MPSSQPKRPVCLVVMGPSGVGKTTIAKLLSQQLGWHFAEADDFHPAANVEKMRAGVPLTDEDRWPWLRLMRDWITEQAASGENCVVTCSALKRRYRDILREAEAQVRFVELSGTPDLVGQRIAGRSHAYMPASLLTSQYATLEPLAADEDGVQASVERAPDDIVADALRRLEIHPAGARV
ncbi:gluconokinase [Aureimonas jatrophae]|uniref:Gluconokinase n=1 Tax=Aureimonas jatrophae TaxID=1166073 RepID=A0A1H0K6X5_9HYPH|nr:gluconokinase [Aureimonas jatrophae]MBB3950970.1 carbohydrate kinase (thermoresistant glucokinase family) [Aureimonas jatrophae]SDO51471.1 gluconate kinase, SKI family [Aureimonas jatrophae]